MTLEITGTSGRVVLKYDNKIIQELIIDAMVELCGYDDILHCIFSILKKNNIKYNKRKVHKELKTIIPWVYKETREWARKNRGKWSRTEYKWPGKLMYGR
jgi:hypothetical protein